MSGSAHLLLLLLPVLQNGLCVLQQLSAHDIKL